MNDLSTALTILSAMITPAVLILATGSLSLTTSNRLSRSIDRVRKVSEKINQLNDPETKESPEILKIERDFLTSQLLMATRRSRLMQRAMTSLYLALSIFVGTIIAIGIFELLGLSFAWVLLILGFSGMVLVLYACMQLILETRLATHAVNKEMDHTLLRYLP